MKNCICDCHATVKATLCGACCAIRSETHILLDRIIKLERNSQEFDYFTEQCKKKFESMDEKNTQHWEDYVNGYALLVKRIEKLENYSNHHAECILSIDSNQKSNEGNLFERVKKLESMYASDFEATQNVILEIQQHKASIEKLDKTLNHDKSYYEALENLIEHAQKGVEKCFERIESEHKDANDALMAVQDRFDNLHHGCFDDRAHIFGQLKELNKWQQAAIEKNIQDTQRLKEIERFQDITHQQYKTVRNKKSPYKCPVCDGEGKNKNKLVMDGIKDQTGIGAISMNNPKCSSCEGKGIVWG